MLSGVYLNLYVMATGFVTAGLLASSVQLVTGRPLGFSMGATETVLRAILGVFARVVAGPVILLRNAVRGRRIEQRPAYWLALSFAIAALWSFFSGVVVLETLLTLSHSL